MLTDIRDIRLGEGGGGGVDRHKRHKTEWAVDRHKPHKTAGWGWWW